MSIAVRTSSEEGYRKLLFFINAFLPTFLMFFDWIQGNLGPNPVEFVTRTTGVMALILLALTLGVTPASKRQGWAWLIKQRRLLGLFSFYYAALHFLTYILFDRGADFASMPADISKRPFIAIGIVCFVLMIPLAVTSTDRMIQRLGGKKWRQLHKLTYVIAVGAVIHFWIIVKSDVTYPLIFGLLILSLLIYRLIYRWK